MKNKKYSFFFHYNKPLSKKIGKTVISIHYKKQCIFVDNIVVNVQTFGHHNKQQPKFVIKGKCTNIEIINKVAIIN